MTGSRFAREERVRDFPSTPQRRFRVKRQLTRTIVSRMIARGILRHHLLGLWHRLLGSSSVLSAVLTPLSGRSLMGAL